VKAVSKSASRVGGSIELSTQGHGSRDWSRRASAPAPTALLYARALIASHGARRAEDIARTNARLEHEDSYWDGVLQAIGEIESGRSPGTNSDPLRPVHAGQRRKARGANR
jgi:hypothetical protein